MALEAKSDRYEQTEPEPPVSVAPNMPAMPGPMVQQLDWMWFHNGLVDEAESIFRNAQNRDAVFHWARKTAIRHFQWLVVHDFLNRVCDRDVVSEVLSTGAPLYLQMLSRSGGAKDGKMPVPLEFLALAGGVGCPLLVLGQNQFAWEDGREGALVGGLPGSTSNDAAKTARHRLILGHRLNLPSAQGSLASLARRGLHLPVLADEAVLSGHSGAIAKTTGLLHATPLALYVFKEVDIFGHGVRFGPLGSRIVAETLCGLVIHDPGSFWHDPGSDADNRWQPADSIAPSGKIFDSFHAISRAGVTNRT